MGEDNASFDNPLTAAESHNAVVDSFPRGMMTRLSLASWEPTTTIRRVPMFSDVFSTAAARLPRLQIQTLLWLSLRSRRVVNRCHHRAVPATTPPRKCTLLVVLLHRKHTKWRNCRSLRCLAKDASVCPRMCSRRRKCWTRSPKGNNSTDGSTVLYLTLSRPGKWFLHSNSFCFLCRSRLVPFWARSLNSEWWNHVPQLCVLMPMCGALYASRFVFLRFSPWLSFLLVSKILVFFHCFYQSYVFIFFFTKTEPAYDAGWLCHCRWALLACFDTMDRLIAWLLCIVMKLILRQKGNV